MRAGCSRVTHPCAGRRHRYCYPRAAPRLACVRPAASVHPEPGSNSSLYISYFSKLNPRTLIPFKEINALEFVFGTLLVLLLPVLSMNFRFHPETLSRLISSRPGASQVPLFPNGIAKVLLFPEPPNFSALFFIFFRRIRTAGDFPAALSRAQWAGRQRNPGPDGQIRPGGIFFRGEERA